MSNLYRKKPVVIEARQLTTDSMRDIWEWIGDSAHECYWSDDDKYISINTLEGYMMARPGDWIIKGVKGEFCPCKPDIFEATYEPEPQEPLRHPRTNTGDR